MTGIWQWPSVVLEMESRPSGSDPDWRVLARCIPNPKGPVFSWEQHNAWFFGRTAKTRAVLTEEEACARDVCARCPVRLRCLEEALRHNEQGVWGGTTEIERRSMRRMR